MYFICMASHINMVVHAVWVHSRYLSSGGVLHKMKREMKMYQDEFESESEVTSINIDGRNFFKLPYENLGELQKELKKLKC